jgi:zinc ribbon protein
LSSSELAGKGGTVFCRECGKSIEADARFCRFCGKSQADPVAGGTTYRSAPAAPAGSSGGTSSGLETRLQQLFPRHHLQDEFMHISTIAAFFMALIGFVLGFFTPALGGNWLSTNFLLGAVALLLFLILRESTLSHIRVRGGGTPAPGPSGGRTHAGRRPTTTAEGPAEAATAESSPPPASRPPATPR